MRTEIHTSVQSEPAEIVVADARPRAGTTLEDALCRQPDLRVVATYETSQDTWQSLRLHRPEVLLLDWHLPDTGAMMLLGRLNPGPDMNVILLTDERNPDTLAEALILGARGAISRSARPDTLLRCTRAVLNGELWFSRRVTRALRDQITADNPVSQDHQRIQDVLTPRETEVVRAVRTGQTNREIAGELGISHQTVRHHLKSVFFKLHVSSRLELALLVERNRM